MQVSVQYQYPDKRGGTIIVNANTLDDAHDIVLSMFPGCRILSSAYLPSTDLLDGLLPIWGG